MLDEAAGGMPRLGEFGGEDDVGAAAVIGAVEELRKHVECGEDAVGGRAGAGNRTRGARRSAAAINSSFER